MSIQQTHTYTFTAQVHLCMWTWESRFQTPNLVVSGRFSLPPEPQLPKSAIPVQ